MKILAVYRSLLKNEPSVNASMRGDVSIGTVIQNDREPNILLELPEIGEEYTHSGPAGLMDGHLKVTCRASSPEPVAELGDVVYEFLKSWTGIESGLEIMLTEHFKTSYKFDEKSKMHQHISEYTTFYRKAD